MNVDAGASEAIWHDVECGGYSADLATWDELATGAGAPVLELGAGTGRVALRLAAAGHRVVAVDTSEPLLAELGRRAADAGLEVETRRADARELELGAEFGAVFAPMQIVHLMEGPAGRAAMLVAARRHLRPGGALAAAVLSDAATWAPFDASAPPLPDVVERDGWVYSSLPIEILAVPGGIEVRRLRQLVSPAGELTESVDAVRLDSLTADDLELEARAAGLAPRERIAIEATDEHVGSVVCVLEAS